MSGSGVMRLRKSKSAPALVSKTIGEGRSDSVGNPKPNVNVGSGLAPAKARPQFKTGPNTGVPQGRALPVRGEHPKG